jgi:hypothetical protein
MARQRGRFARASGARNSANTARVGDEPHPQLLSGIEGDVGGHRRAWVKLHRRLPSCASQLAARRSQESLTGNGIGRRGRGGIEARGQSVARRRVGWVVRSFGKEGGRRGQPLSATRTLLSRKASNFEISNKIKSSDKYVKLQLILIIPRSRIVKKVLWVREILLSRLWSLPLWAKLTPLSGSLSLCLNA